MRRLEAPPNEYSSAALCSPYVDSVLFCVPNFGTHSICVVCDKNVSQPLHTVLQPLLDRYETVTRPLHDRYTTVTRPRSGAFRHVLFRVPKKQNMILGFSLPSPVTMPLPHSAQTSLERYSTVERPLRDHFATVTRPFRDFARDAPHSAVSHPTGWPCASSWAAPAQKARPPPPYSNKYSQP